LRKHFASVHLLFLDDFETGWNSLGDELQTKWMSGGIPRYNCVDLHERPTVFRSWTEVICRELKVRAPDPSTLINEFYSFLHEKLDDASTFYNLPKMSGFVGPDTRTEDVAEDIRKDTAKKVSTQILCLEIQKTMERLKLEIEEHGIDVIRNYFPEIFSKKETKGTMI